MVWWLCRIFSINCTKYYVNRLYIDLSLALMDEEPYIPSCDVCYVEVSNDWFLKYRHPFFPLMTCALCDKNLKVSE